MQWLTYLLIKFPELVLASYSKNTASVRESMGIVQVWSTHLQSRPEFVFQAQVIILILLLLKTLIFLKYDAERRFSC